MDASPSIIQPIRALLEGMPPRALFLAALPDGGPLAELLVARLASSTKPLLRSYSHEGETPLMWAAHFDNVDYAEALAPHSNLCAFDRNGDSALCFAARRGSTETARLLSRLAGQNFTNANNATPLMMAARGGATETLFALLPESTPSHCDLNGNNALMHALAESHLQASLALIPETPLGQRNVVNYAALGIAAFRGLDEACMAILRQLHGQDYPAAVVEQQVADAVLEARKGARGALAIQIEQMSQALREEADLQRGVLSGAHQCRAKSSRI